MSDSKDTTDFSPAIFNDPVAEQTEWKWLHKGGSNFKTHRLVVQQNGNIHFKLSIQSYIFSFFLVGLFAFAPLILVFAEPFLIVIVAPFPVLAFWFLYHTFKPISFDLERNHFYHGWLKRNTSIETQDIPWCSLDEVHALQIIGEYVYGSDRDFNSYESQ